MDTINGTVKEVLSRDSSIPLAPPSHAIALQTEKSIVVATNQSLLIIESDDNSWTRGVTIQNKMKVEEGEMVVAVAMREGESVYVLVNSQKGYKIEEAVWEESSKEYVYVLWCFILGSILAASLYLWLVWGLYGDKIQSNTPYGHVYWDVNWRKIYYWFLKR